jgi:hypothetical protein
MSPTALRARLSVALLAVAVAAPARAQEASPPPLPAGTYGTYFSEVLR